MFSVNPKKQRGFTLIELLAVMAIVAVLAGIVAVAVGGTGETSRDTQAQQDATTVETAAADFSSDQEGAEVLRPLSASVLDQGPFRQVKSSKWPEEYISVAYNNVLPETTTSTVSSVTFLTEPGTLSSLTLEELLTNYNAIDIDTLFAFGFLSTIPYSGAQLTDDTYSNYLRLLQKTTAFGGSSKGAARQIAVFKLVSIEKNEINNLVDLTYLQLVGEISEEAAVNNAPAADQNIAATTIKNGSRIITLLATDSDGDDLTFDVLTGVADGPFQGTLNTSLLTATPPQVIYNPATNFVGSDFFTFTVSDGDLTDQAQVFISIEEPQALAVAPAVLDFGTTETSKTFVITNSGGSFLTWSITDDQTWIGATPTLGSTTTETDTITITVDRTGLAVGNYNGTITVASNDGTKIVSVAMHVPAPLIITTNALPGGTVNSPYAGATLQASGGTGTLAWPITLGSLPTGLNLTTAGVISGTPAVDTAVIHTFAVEVTDSAGVKNTRVLGITVTP